MDRDSAIQFKKALYVIKLVGRLVYQRGIVVLRIRERGLSASRPELLDYNLGGVGSDKLG